MRTRLVIAAAVAPFLLAACGGSDDNSADEPSTSPPSSSSAAPSDTASSTAPATTDATEPSESTGTAAPADDETAVEQTMTDFLLAPRCDLATDKYLLDRSLFADNVKDACQELKDTFVQPQFTADDIVYTNLKINGDTATVEVGSKLINITTKYRLSNVDGSWLVSGDEYNSDL